MEGQPPTHALPNLNVITTTIDPDDMPAGHSGQRLTEPMCDEETQDSALLALGVAATSGFVESVIITGESCLTMCNTCRDKVPVPRLKVRRFVPPSIMEMVYPGVGQAKADDSSRVEPHRMVLDVDWRFFDNRCPLREEDGDEEGSQGAGPREEPETEARNVDYAAHDDIDISKIQWPMGTTDVSLTCFNRRIDAMTWPPGLKRLWFGNRRAGIYRDLKTWEMFNMPLDAVTLPGGLREIFLGNRFNQSIEGVAWPGGLERLSLPGFNHSIQNVQWPPGLISLEFVSSSDIQQWGCDDISFEQFEYDDIYERSFLGSESSHGYRDHLDGFLEEGVFDQPLGTTLPPSLRTLWLPKRFHQPLHNVAWPSGMTFLGLAFDIFTCFPGVIRWPPNLQYLCMTNKPEPEDGFSYPPDCEVTIFIGDNGGDTNYGNFKCYDRDDDPNAFSEDSDRYDGYNDDIYYYSD